MYSFSNVTKKLYILISTVNQTEITKMYSYVYLCIAFLYIGKKNRIEDKPSAKPPLHPYTPTSFKPSIQKIEYYVCRTYSKHCKSNLVSASKPFNLSFILFINLSSREETVG